MFQCPKCAAKLLEDNGYCQFCKSSWAAPKATKPSPLQANAPALGETQPWVWKAYYGIAIWWMLNGAWDILHSTVLATKDASSGMIGIIAGAFTLLIGLGLVLKVPLVRRLVNFSCFLNIAVGLLGLVGSFFSPAITGFLGIFTVIMQLLDIGLSGLMIYIIGETDQTPDF